MPGRAPPDRPPAPSPARARPPAMLRHHEGDRDLTCNESRRYLKQGLEGCGGLIALSGRHLRGGARQPIPSVSIESCAGVSETLPCVPVGHKVPTLELRGVEHQSLTIPEQDLEQVPATTMEDEQRTR